MPHPLFLMSLENLVLVLLPIMLYMAFIFIVLGIVFTAINKNKKMGIRFLVIGGVFLMLFATKFLYTVYQLHAH